MEDINKNAINEAFGKIGCCVLVIAIVLLILFGWVN